MKKSILFLALIATIALSACGNKSATPTGKTGSDSTISQDTTIVDTISKPIVKPVK